MHRQDNDTVQEIENLIRSTNDPETKGILLVLLRVASVLGDAIQSNNTTQDRLANLDSSIGKKVKELTDDRTFSKGFVKGIVTLWIAVQGIVGYVAFDLIQSTKEGQSAVVRLDERVRALERPKN